MTSLDCQVNLIQQEGGIKDSSKCRCDIVMSNPLRKHHNHNIGGGGGKMHLKRMMLNERTSKKRGSIFLHVSTDTKSLFSVMTDVGLGSPERQIEAIRFFSVTIVKCVKSQCQVPRALKPYRKKWVSAAATSVKAKQKCLSNPLVNAGCFSIG